ncbi:hypothetical protein ACFVH9_08410 [Streptomyces hirsutus]|uniref:hypothetical protein n=1 Tax=Streptomyces hirsutus TaxID=35620 RepID=UPI00362B5104
MFTEAIKSSDSASVSTGTASEPHALVLLRRASNRGYAIQPLRTGGAIVRYRRAGLGAPRLFVHTFTPIVPADPSSLDLSNLRLIDEVKTARFVGSDRYAAGVIEAGAYEIPPSQTERLAGQGFLVRGQDGSLRLTLSARLTLVAVAHECMDSSDRTTTWCSCGLAVHCKNAESADARRLGHLTAVAADFLDSLSPAFTAAVTAV